MNGLKYGLIALLLGLAHQAHAANWVYVGENTEGNLFYVDYDSFQFRKDAPYNLWFWQKTLWSPTSNFSKNFNITTSKYRMRVNCKYKTSMITSYVSYDAVGRVVSYVPDHKKNMDPVVPDSLEEDVSSFICGDAWGR